MQFSTGTKKKDNKKKKKRKEKKRKRREETERKKFALQIHWTETIINHQSHWSNEPNIEWKTLQTTNIAVETQDDEHI